MVDLDRSELWGDGLDVNWLEPLVPRAPLQVSPDLPSDEDCGVTSFGPRPLWAISARQAGRSLDQHRDVQVVAVEKGAEAIGGQVQCQTVSKRNIW